MKIPVDTIKKLRELTSASVMECRKALEDSKGDMDEAKALLRKRGIEKAAKKQDRAAKEGRIEAYVHLGNKIGVLVEINCETDFVARNTDFMQFCRDVSMHIAACNPLCVKREEVPSDELKDVKEKEAFYKQQCLLEQPFVKDPSITIHDYVGSIIGKIGENIVIRRFTRYKIGE